MSKKLYKSLKAQKDQTEQVKLIIYGSLGIFLGGQKVVQVANRQGYVYVRLRENQNEIIQAFNNRVASSYGLPVIVVREGGRYIVQQYNSQRYLNNALNPTPFLPGHGTQHSFPRGGGADITWVYGQQIIPALVYPSPTTGTNVYIDRYPLYTPDNRWIYAGGTGTQNILQYLPTTGSSSLMVLVYMDAYTGNPGILVGSGTYFPANVSGSIYQYIPSPSVNQIPLAGVLLNTGTQSITWSNIYDVRQWVHATPSGTSSGAGGGGAGTIGFVGQNKGTFLATGTTLNVNGTRIILSVSGTTFNLTNSPDPAPVFGFYGLSGTTGLATGTSLSVGNYLLLSATGTTLYLAGSVGTGTSQLASGDRGVTNGDTHDHNGGDGGQVSHLNLSNIGANQHTQIDDFITGFSSGWTNTLDAWSYASASTITVSSTTLYQKGMKIRFKQGGAYKYYNVASVTPTVITVVVNATYTVANAAITDVGYSYVENPYGFPTEFDWTPAWTNLTVGDGTQTAKYSMQGGKVSFHCDIILGGTSSVGTSPTLTLPITKGTYGQTTQIGIARYKDATGGNANAGVIFDSGILAVYNSSATYATGEALTATVPFTWATSDIISIAGEYFA